MYTNYQWFSLQFHNKSWKTLFTTYVCILIYFPQSCKVLEVLFFKGVQKIFCFTCKDHIREIWRSALWKTCVQQNSAILDIRSNMSFEFAENCLMIRIFDKKMFCRQNLQQKCQCLKEFQCQLSYIETQVKF